MHYPFPDFCHMNPASKRYGTPCIYIFWYLLEFTMFWHVRRVCFRKICRPFLLISQVSDCSRVVDRGVYRETQKGLRGGRGRRTANHDPSVCLSGIFFDLGTSMCADDMSIIIQYFATRLPAITFYDEVSFFNHSTPGHRHQSWKRRLKRPANECQMQVWRTK